MDFSLTALVVVVAAYLLCSIIGIVNASRRERSMHAARAGYEEQLRRLKAEPYRVDLRERALKAGRSYAKRTRKCNVKTYDERAIEQDIRVALGEIASAPYTPQAGSPQVPARVIASRLAAIDGLFALGVINEHERVGRRRKLLNEL